MEKIINNLINNNSSKNKQSDKNNCYLHYSGIYKGNKNVCYGCNNGRNVFNGRCICFSTHAEMDVIIKLLKVAEDKTLQTIC
jgi:hypothetical protein